MGKLALPIVLALPVLLGGCVAAALPVVAGGLIAREGVMGGEAKETPPAPGLRVPIFTDGDQPRGSLSTAVATVPARPEGRANVVTTLPAPPTATDLIPPISEPARALPSAAPAAVLPPPASSARTMAGERPSASGGTGAYSTFARYVVSAASGDPAAARRSALIDPESLVTGPRLADCGDQPPAAVIDLDRGNKPFDLEDPPSPAPGLAEALTQLRNQGITVLWSASLPAAKSEKLYTILSATGLDPDRTDRLLLNRNGDERKQSRRLAAARDWCIIAIAGDSKGDFEEAFDYLRDPTGPIALGLEPNIGNRWFLVPPPID